MEGVTRGLYMLERSAGGYDSRLYVQGWSVKGYDSRQQYGSEGLRGTNIFRKGRYDHNQYLEYLTAGYMCKGGVPKCMMAGM